MQYGGPAYPPQQPAYAQPPYPQPPPPPAKKSGGGLWIGCGIVLVLLLVGAALAGGAYLFFMGQKPTPHLARYAPKNASVFVEMPSFQHAVIAAAGMKPLDSSRIDEKQMQQELTLAFVNAFTIPQEDARAIVLSFDAAAFVARDTNRAGQAAVMVTFSNKSIEKVFASGRFSLEGPFVSGGMRYTLEKRPPSTVSPNAGVLEHGLSDMETGHGTKRLDLVWFPKKKLLVFGDDQMATDMAAVLDGNADTLEKNEAYKAAKKTFESGADVAFFFDPHDLDDVTGSDKKLVDGLLKNRDPMTGAIKIVKAGVMMDAHATLTGASLPPDDLVPPATKLTSPRRLPGDTIGYMAMSSKTKMPSAAIHALLSKAIADGNATAEKEFRQGLESTETSLGFKLDDVLDLMGDEAAFAILLDPAFKLDTTNGIADELSNFGVVLAIAVKDDAKAKLVLAKLRAELETPDVAAIAKLKAIPNGWEVDPDTKAAFPVPNLTVKYDGKQILAVIAGTAMTTRALDALERDKDTLKASPAHELALGALPQDANFYMWMDTGRITSVMTDGATHVHKSGTRSIVPVDAIRLIGNDRLTTAVAIRISPQKGTWLVDIDSLNLPATALFSIASELDLGDRNAARGHLPSRHGALMEPSKDWKETIAPGEGESFEKFATILADLQRLRGGKDRALHAKQHAGLRAEIEILGELPAHARVGLFAEPKKYDAYVRFSNGGGRALEDKKPDVRGFAIKILGVSGKKLIPGMEEETTQDFLFINTPALGFRTVEEFVVFAQASTSEALLPFRLFAKFGFGTFGLLKRLLASVRKMTSLATETYYTVAPIRFGDYAARLSLAPHQKDPPAELGVLAEELAARLAKDALVWDLRGQFFLNEELTPIEETSRVWPESDAPPVVLARITIPKQDIASADGKKLAEMISKLSFDPWHAREDHRPLGAAMRARSPAYRESTKQRGAAKEPR